MALFLLENKDFLGFRMIFKVPLNQIFSNFNTMLYTIKYRLSLIRQKKKGAFPIDRLTQKFYHRPVVEIGTGPTDRDR